MTQIVVRMGARANRKLLKWAKMSSALKAFVSHFSSALKQLPGEVQSSQGVGCYTFLLQRKLRMQLLIVLYAELTDPSRLPSKAWQRLLLKPVSPPLTSQMTRIDSLITMQDAGCAPIPALRSTGSSSCL